MKILILAGGEGKRLFPLSTEDRPKQFLQFSDGQSLLYKTIHRFLKAGYADDIFVLTQQRYYDLVAQDLGKFFVSCDHKIIIEPAKKNTGPAILWGIRYLLQHKIVSYEDLILVVPADHYFCDEKELMSAIQLAKMHAYNGSIVAFGVKCTRAETGFGYIHPQGDAVYGSYKVDCFIEKPELKLAEQLISSNEWLWNMGIYLFDIRTLMRNVYETANALSKLLDAEDPLIIYRDIAEISIDKALIEHIHNLQVIPLTYTLWWDIGSFERVSALHLEQEVVLI